MYIVTGGAGFIGSIFISKLNAEGIEDILIVDHLGTSPKWKNLSRKFFLDYIPKERFLDMLRSGGIPGARRPKDIKGIVHLGACSTTTELDMDYLMENNVRFSRALIEYAVANGIRMIYASSAATYGDGVHGYADDEQGLRALRPLNRYGYSKQLVDLWCQRHGHLTRVAALKFFNVYGPNEYHKEGQFSGVYRSFLQARESGSVKLFKSYNQEYDDGEQKRDFVYVKDCAEVMWWLLQNPQANGIFNLGSGRATSWNQLARAVFAALGMQEKIEYVDMPENLRKQYQYFTQAEMQKLTRAGYQRAFTSLEDGVRDYVLNHLGEDDQYC